MHNDFDSGEAWSDLIKQTLLSTRCQQSYLVRKYLILIWFDSCPIYYPMQGWDLWHLLHWDTRGRSRYYSFTFYLLRLNGLNTKYQELLKVGVWYGNWATASMRFMLEIVHLCLNKAGKQQSVNMLDICCLCVLLSNFFCEKLLIMGSLVHFLLITPTDPSLTCQTRKNISWRHRLCQYKGKEAVIPVWTEDWRML